MEAQRILTLFVDFISSVCNVEFDEYWVQNFSWGYHKFYLESPKDSFNFVCAMLNFMSFGCPNIVEICSIFQFYISFLLKGLMKLHLNWNGGHGYG